MSPFINPPRHEQSWQVGGPLRTTGAATFGRRGLSRTVRSITRSSPSALAGRACNRHTHATRQAMFARGQLGL